MKKNSIMTITPYKCSGQWVFDDQATGLEREAFVAGADDILDIVTQAIPGAEQGVTVLFSEHPFPGHQLRLEHKGSGDFEVGDDYWCEQLQMGCWLCPALLRYFEKAPDNIYAQFKQAKPVVHKEPINTFPRITGMLSHFWE